MKRRDVFLVICAAIAWLSAWAAGAQTYVYRASCGHSYSKQEDVQVDLTTKAGRPIKCDSVVLPLTQNGHVLLQFAEKRSDLTPLGFASAGLDYETNPNFITLPLQRIYLPHANNPSKPEVIDGIEASAFSKEN